MSINFAREVEEILHYIADTIEENDPEGEIEIDIKSDIIHIITNRGAFVINKQAALEEIWLSSPISGPYHFSKRDGTWKTKNDSTLYLILSKELNMNFNR